MPAGDFLPVRCNQILCGGGGGLYFFLFIYLMEAPWGTSDNMESKFGDFLKHELELERRTRRSAFDRVERVHRLGRPWRLAVFQT